MSLFPPRWVWSCLLAFARAFTSTWNAISLIPSLSTWFLSDLPLKYLGRVTRSLHLAGFRHWMLRGLASSVLAFWRAQTGGCITHTISWGQGQKISWKALLFPYFVLFCSCRRGFTQSDWAGIKPRKVWFKSLCCFCHTKLLSYGTCHNALSGIITLRVINSLEGLNNNHFWLSWIYICFAPGWICRNLDHFGIFM